MSGVRNGVLARATLTAAGWTVLGAVPAGSTALVKTVQIYNHGAAEARVFVVGQTANGQIAMQLPDLVAAPTQSQIWEGWTTLMVTDTLWANTSQAGVDVWISGALLPGEASGLVPAGPLASPPTRAVTA